MVNIEAAKNKMYKKFEELVELVNKQDELIWTRFEIEEFRDEHKGLAALLGEKIKEKLDEKIEERLDELDKKIEEFEDRKKNKVAEIKAAALPGKELGEYYPLLKSHVGHEKGGFELDEALDTLAEYW